ncbi:MAG: hypothetical protein ACTHM8_05635 [Sphingomonas sp.]
MPFEILDLALVLLRGVLAFESAEVVALAGLGVLLARIDAPAGLGLRIMSDLLTACNARSMGFIRVARRSV